MHVDLVGEAWEEVADLRAADEQRMPGRRVALLDHQLVRGMWALRRRLGCLRHLRRGSGVVAAGVEDHAARRAGLGRRGLIRELSVDRRRAVVIRVLTKIVED